MITFDEVVAACDEHTKSFIEARFRDILEYLSKSDYDKEYDDITPHLFEEIGDALFYAVFEDDDFREDVKPPEVPTGKYIYYCTTCEAAREFIVSDDGMRVKCGVCGKVRHSMTGSIPKR